MRRSVGLALVAVLMSGCFFGATTILEYRYYVLDYPPASARARQSKDPWNANLLVRNFPIGEAYLRSEIVFRSSTQEIRYRPKDRWAVRPDHVVSDMARKHLVDSRLFQSVQSQYEENQPDYELKGRVIALEEYIEGPSHSAHLDLRLEFVRISDNKVLWQREYDAFEPVSDDNRAVLVLTLSGMLRSRMDSTVPAIDSVMAGMPHGI
jgi:ABC-type uncharacterized transport system auxiliary subunit